MPKDYQELETLRAVEETHENVKIATWNDFFDQFDNDDELKAIKKSLNAANIDGVQVEEDYYSQAVDFGLISPSIIKNNQIAFCYIAQVIVRWHLQAGLYRHSWKRPPAHIAENFAVWNFALTESEMKKLTEMDTGRRYESW